MIVLAGEAPTKGYVTAVAWLAAQRRDGRPRSPALALELFGRLGRPDLAFPTVRVLGTNGKGSVCAMLDAGLQVEHASVGRFTSPHLEDFSERITVGGKPVSSGFVTEFVKAAQGWPRAAFFDLTLAMACEWFRLQSVDLAVIEAGVGGGSDATSALPPSRLTVITNVGHDHLATIGPSLLDVAREKAGGISPGAPTVTAATGAALAIVRRGAAARGSQVYALEDGDRLFDLPRAPRLEGAHQLENAALAAAALRLLGSAEPSVNAALAASWPGRFERVPWEFSPGLKVTVVLDGAHNQEAAEALTASLPPGFLLVFGVMARKDWRRVIVPLAAKAEGVIVTWPGEGGLDPHVAAEEFGFEMQPFLPLALQEAARRAGDGGLVVVAGSLYLVGAARSWLRSAGASVGVAT